MIKPWLTNNILYIVNVGANYFSNSFELLKEVSLEALSSLATVEGCPDMLYRVGVTHRVVTVMHQHLDNYRMLFYSVYI